tara:strand:+ start:75 stop:323 length:249 start_codon:yes stop_codon:yes gene_type:complete
MLNNIVENAVALNNSDSQVEENRMRNRLIGSLLNLMIILVINLVIGPYLWNEVMRSLVPACGKARWFDTVALGALIVLIKPN